MNQEPSIELLLNRCQEGNRQAQFELYERYYRAMFNVSLRFFPDPNEAEEMMQESFLKAFQKLDQFQRSAPFGVWLRQIVINTCIKELKKNRLEFQLMDAETLASIPESEEDSMQGISGEMVDQAIQELPDGYRVILSLYLLEGYDHEEISTVLGISASTSRSQYSRAKNKLKNSLQKQAYV